MPTVALPAANGMMIATIASEAILSKTDEVMMPVAAAVLFNPSDFKDTRVKETAVAVMAKPKIKEIFKSLQK